MNKITRLTIAALCGSMMLSVSGCNSLDQMPTNKFTDDSFWSSADRAQSVLNMAYSQMYSHDKIWQDESLSDNMYELKGSPDSHTIRAGLANASLGLFESEWKWLYQGIKTTNVFMDKIDLVPDQRQDLPITQLRADIDGIQPLPLHAGGDQGVVGQDQIVPGVSNGAHGGLLYSVPACPQDKNRARQYEKFTALLC